MQKLLSLFGTCVLILALWTLYAVLPHLQYNPQVREDQIWHLFLEKWALGSSICFKINFCATFPNSIPRQAPATCMPRVHAIWIFVFFCPYFPSRSSSPATSSTTFWSPAPSSAPSPSARPSSSASPALRSGSSGGYPWRRWRRPARWQRSELLKNIVHARKSC